MAVILSIHIFAFVSFNMTTEASKIILLSLMRNDEKVSDSAWKELFPTIRLCLISRIMVLPGDVMSAINLKIG